MEQTNIRFCEGRINEYNVLPGISEFWNTLSSLVMIIVSLYRIIYTPNTRAYQLMFLNGVGSIIYHSTFTLFGKYFDEFTMIACLCFCIVQLAETKEFLIFCLFLCTIISNVLDSHGYLFRIYFASIFVILLYSLRTIYPRETFWVKTWIIQGTILNAIGLGFWVLDELFCSVNFFYFHSFWHIFMTFGCLYYIDAITFATNLKIK